MSRDDLIDQLYAHVRMHMPVSREAYGKSLADWEIVPVMIDGQSIGVRIMRGHEVHHLLDKKAARTLRPPHHRAVRRRTARPLGLPDFAYR